ncbi:piggyBac transposable element-derived protein 3-like [Anthonomus grandis grandis]|uniref:piggyBac transposable element-derived protein 3-like n=1 Tax=Anthonomus grandis grandis TaxID=2921223 RepID=UPI002165A9B7|nr:piggyBac transposable element-derived protein 3-like [Anthonomus grandis grandis]
MAEIENLDDDELIPDAIAVLPPVNANEYNTDEDFGDENEVDINNLPGSQLMTEVKVIFENKGSNQTTVESDFDSDDDLPLSIFLRKKRPKLSTSKPNYSWKKGDINQDFPEWVNASGLKNSLFPLELFFQYIDDEIIDLVVKYSNLYAIQHNRQGNIHSSEIKCFVGVLLLSGYNSLPRRSMYWENNSDAGNKFSKLRNLFSTLNEKFQSFAPLEECHSVDESMVPYYGGHGSRQYIRGKSIRWGYKVWVGTTKKGYIEWFEPYQESTTIIFEKYHPLGLGASVVLQFADIIQSQCEKAPFYIFCDIVIFLRHYVCWLS